MRSAGGTAYPTGRVLSANWDIYPVWVFEEVAFTRYPGRLESELGKKGGVLGTGGGRLRGLRGLRRRWSGSGGGY